MLKDHLGSTRAVLNETNSVVTSYDYMPYGNIMRSYVNTEVTYQFTGQEYDTELSLHNFRARMYDSDLGMFYAVDPAGQGFSSFGYAGNNPVINVDRNGQWFWAALKIGFDIYQAYTIATSAYNVGQAIAHGDIGGLVQGIVATGANMITGSASQSLSGLGGFVGGAIKGASGTIASNFVTGQSWNDGVVTNALFSGVSNYVSNMSQIELASEGVGTGKIGSIPDDEIHKYAKEKFNMEIGRKGLIKLTGAETPSGYLLTKNGSFLEDLNWWENILDDPVNAAGITVSGNKIQGKNGWESSVYISPSTQGTEQYFHLTLGHELIHVSQNFRGLTNSNFKEAVAYKWTWKEAQHKYGDENFYYRAYYKIWYEKYRYYQHYKGFKYYKFIGF